MGGVGESRAGQGKQGRLLGGAYYHYYYYACFRPVRGLSQGMDDSEHCLPAPLLFHVELDL